METIHERNHAFITIHERNQAVMNTIHNRFEILNLIPGFPKAMRQISKASKELSSELNAGAIFSPQLFNLAFLLGMDGFIDYNTETGETHFSGAFQRKQVLSAFPSVDIRDIPPRSVNQKIYKKAYLLSGVEKAMSTLSEQAYLDPLYEAPKDFQAAASLLNIL